MSEQRFCDVCGRFEKGIPALTSDEAANEEPALQIDADGLWVCQDCRARLVTIPIGDVADVELPDEIKALVVGKSAGAICPTSLPIDPSSTPRTRPVYERLVLCGAVAGGDDGLARRKRERHGHRQPGW